MTGIFRIDTPSTRAWLAKQVVNQPPELTQDDIFWSLNHPHRERAMSPEGVSAHRAYELDRRHRTRRPLP